MSEKEQMAILKTYDAKLFVKKLAYFFTYQGNLEIAERPVPLRT